MTYPWRDLVSGGVDTSGGDSPAPGPTLPPGVYEGDVPGTYYAIVNGKMVDTTATGAPLRPTGADLGSSRYTTYYDEAGNKWQRDNLDGSESIIQHAPRGSTTIVNAGTGGAHYTLMYGPEGYGTYETSSGVPILVGLKADPNAPKTDPRDKNADMIDDSTGWALGVYKDPSSPSGYYYDPGDGSLVAVTPKGAPYSGPDLTPGSGNGLHYFSSGGLEYAYDPKTGKTTAIGGQPTSRSSGGGSSGSNAGASAAIAAAASQANAALQAQTQANELAERMREFGITSAADKQKFLAGQDQFERTFSAQQARDAAQRAKDDEAAKALRAKTTVDYVSNPNDMVARNYWLHGGLEPTGTPVDIFTGQASGPATTQGALNTSQSMQAAGGLTSSAPPVAALRPPVPPGLAHGTDTRAGYTTAPVAEVGERGTEIMQNPTGAPIRILNHEQVMGRQPVPPPRFATGTDLGGYSTAAALEAYNNAVPANYVDPYVAPNFTSADTQGFDLAAYLGIPMTAGQRTAVANQAATTYETGQFADNRAPYITQPQVQAIMAPPKATTAAPAPPPQTYDQATAAATGHIDPATGQWVANASGLTNAGTAPAPAPTPPPAPKAGTTAAAAPQSVYSLPQGAPAFVGSLPPEQKTVPAGSVVGTPPPTPATPQPTQQGLPVTPAPPATVPPPAAATPPVAPPVGNPPSAVAPPTGSAPPTVAPPPSPNAIAYNPAVYANLPSLRYLQGLMDPQDYANLTSNTSAAGGLGGALPAPNQLNYSTLLYLKRTDPTGYAAMQSIWRARNRDLDEEMNYAQQRAPAGNARESDTIST